MFGDPLFQGINAFLIFALLLSQFLDRLGVGWGWSFRFLFWCFRGPIRSHVRLLVSRFGTTCFVDDRLLVGGFGRPGFLNDWVIGWLRISTAKNWSAAAPPPGVYVRSH